MSSITFVHDDQHGVAAVQVLIRVQGAYVVRPQGVGQAVAQQLHARRGRALAQAKHPVRGVQQPRELQVLVLSVMSGRV